MQLQLVHLTACCTQVWHLTGSVISVLLRESFFRQIGVVATQEQAALKQLKAAAGGKGGFAKGAQLKTAMSQCHPVLSPIFLVNLHNI